MKSLDNLMTEEQAVAVSDKVLALTLSKITDHLNTAFYNEMKSYLFEHYFNSADDIKKSLIRELADEFTNDPSNYKFRAVRERLWEENKDKIIPALTDDAIKSNMERLLMEYTSSKQYFHWQWKDGIVKIILQNWDKFKDDKVINEQFGRVLAQKQSVIEHLQSQLNEARAALNQIQD